MIYEAIVFTMGLDKDGKKIMCCTLPDEWVKQKNIKVGDTIGLEARNLPENNSCSIKD
jgi:hypothetical protein